MGWVGGSNMIEALKSCFHFGVSKALTIAADCKRLIRKCSLQIELDEYVYVKCNCCGVRNNSIIYTKHFIDNTY